MELAYSWLYIVMLSCEWKLLYENEKECEP